MSKRHYIIPIFVPHEGCPHNCVFCNQNSITGNEIVVVDEAYAEEVIETHLRTINKEDSIIEISFFGGTFTAIHMDKQKKLLAVAKKYKDSGKIDYIRLSTRPDYIDHDILMNLKTYGVDIIELGVQSMDNEVLEYSGRGHTEEDVVRASILIKEYGFILGIQIMLGLPKDTFHKDIETVKKVINLKPHLSRIYPALVVKNTPMEIMHKNGKYNPYTLEEAVTITKVVFGMLSSNGINVIRIGLQPTEEINYGKEIVAGPFHPAFRELVQSSIINDMIHEFLIEKTASSIGIIINPKTTSKLYANRKQYFKDMISKLNLQTIPVLEDSNLEQNIIKVLLNEDEYTLSIDTYIWRKYKEGYTYNL